MDRLQKKVLDENLQYLQENLVLNELFYAGMIQNGIFTEDMVKTIQAEPSPNGRILELVHLVKKRNSTSFDSLVEVMRTTSQEHLADRLCSALEQKTLGPTNSSSADKVKEFLNKHYVKIRKMSLADLRLAMDNLVMKSDLEREQQEKSMALQHSQQLQTALMKKDEDSQEMRSRLDFYIKDSQEHQTKIRSLEEELRRLRKRNNQTDTGHGGLKPLTRSMSQNSDGYSSARYSPDDELRQMLKQKDEVMKRKDEEYNQLKDILELTQNDLQSVLDLNNQYLTIISQLNQLQMNTASKVNTDRGSDNETAELEKQLELSHAKVVSLNQRLVDTCCHLEEKKEELQEVLQRERKYKEMLGLPGEASETQVTNRIKEISKSGSLQRKELDKMRKELAQVKLTRNQLEDKLSGLTREKDQVEFHIRQQDLTIKKMQRLKTAKETIDSAEAMLGGVAYKPAPTSTRSSLPSLAPATVEVAPSQLRLQTSQDVLNQYCVLCRKEVRAHGTTCRIHFRDLRKGKWQCCHDDCYRSAGCLHTSHFYVEITADKRVLLTNGEQYVALG